MARQEQMALQWRSANSVNGKAWVNQILETNTVPTIWVTNRIEQIDPAFRRRFAYHLELKSPPPGAREAAHPQDAGRRAVGDTFVAKLTERKGLTPAQIRTAVRFAGLGAGRRESAPSEGMGLETLIERQLKNADAALGNPPDGKRPPASVTTYDLAMLNVETRFEIPRIVEALKARGHGTLCFYGAPGTGKTALGEHIAARWAKPLIVKQASDLMSKFVGETEQNMAAMFKEAEDENAVLLLDEADSLPARPPWRAAQLRGDRGERNAAGMERFNGIFVCTTNLLDRIDQAALRRFTFKIKFKPLTASSANTMFVTEALDGVADRPDRRPARAAGQAGAAMPGRFRRRETPD
jgi:SpoVK/Ycf46/Vps4 family AAA+-type ATPase